MKYPGLLPWAMDDLTDREWRAICADVDNQPSRLEEVA